MRWIRWIGIAGRMLREGRTRELRYVAWRRWHGLDLVSVELDELGLPAERANFYANSPGPSLEAVFRRLKIPPGSALLDFGSGKGGAALLLARLPFSEVVGVELSPELVRIAEANRERLRLKHVRFVCIDAAAFADLDRFTHVYMFNPFPAAVMEPVLQNLRRSLEQSPRDLTLVYKNPVHHDLVMASGLFPAYEIDAPPEEQPFHIYHHARA
jgi:SAM-dependent methyltransferase